MSKIEHQIHFEQLGLGSVLKRYQLGVPSNQREYSWTEREVTTLLQDFAQAISDDEPGYFLGTIVTIPQLQKNSSLEVVDGQQRLATTAILLACIREYLKPLEMSLATSIDTDFLIGFDRSRREQVPKLTLNLSDNDFFRAKLTAENPQPTPSRPSHHRLEAAFEQCKGHIKNIVSTYAEKDHGDVLNKWISFVENKALVVLVRVTDDANAYKMFETLNDRGLKTSQSDLVKNYLFGQASERIGEVQEKWALMRGALESLENEDITIDFLRHVLIAVHGFVRENQVYETVQGIAKSPQRVVAFATNLESLANVYVAIHNPEHEKWNKYGDSVRRGIEVLNLFNIRPMRPLMLAIAAKFDEKETDESFKFLISLSVRLLIAATTRSGSVEQPLASVAHDVFSEKIKTAAAIKDGLKNITPSDDQFKLAFEAATVSKMQLARYYLRSLEMAAKNESEPWLIPNDDRQAINLEHVLPRKPEGNWPTFTVDEANIYLNRIGNLALMQASKNSDLKSDNFKAKKKIYATSPYVLTKQIADAAKWDVQAVTDRQKSLTSYALLAWKI